MINILLIFSYFNVKLISKNQILFYDQ